MHAISCRGGKKVWTQSTDGAIYSSPTVAEGHLFIGSDDEQLRVLNILAGREGDDFLDAADVEILRRQYAATLRYLDERVAELVEKHARRGEHVAVDDLMIRPDLLSVEAGG